MTEQTVRPVVVASKCLGFEACRWNGIAVSDAFVDSLEDHVTFQTTCPEVEIGLGCPRKPIRIVRGAEGERLVQPETGRDVTDKMTAFVQTFLDAIDTVDGFILKYKSPSCGISNVKLYPNPEAKTPAGRTAGFFGRAVQDRFPDLPIEDEGRLHNFSIREHWLTKLFTLARFRNATEAGRMRDLVRFHTEHKLLLMAYSQKSLKALGRIVANEKKIPLDELVPAYRTELGRAFARAPKFTSAINVLMHGMGYFSEELGAEEKAFFLDTLEQYRNAQVPLSVPVGVLKSWIVRFSEEYLASQVFFEPYPRALVEITDSGKGRKIR